MSETIDSIIATVLASHPHEQEQALEMLQDLQDRWGWIPPQALDALASALKLPRARIEGCAHFYRFLNTAPQGEYRLLWSDNITDRMAGSQDLQNHLARLLWIEPGHSAADGLVYMDTTSCTGLCDQGPALLVNGQAIGGMTRTRVESMAQLIQSRTPISAWPSHWFQIHDHLRRRDLMLANPPAPGLAVQSALTQGGERMLRELELARLRGRGGAGFATATKWRSCREASGPVRYVVCNADEGEPGTFKDRALLNSHADLVWDGMTIAGMVVGASKGLLYLRGEYRFLLPALLSSLERRRRANLLGISILGQAGFDFEIEIRLGAGAYICGEESALIESLEGKPGRPRIRPPYPVTCGYLNRPTVINNVETLAAVAIIATEGGANYARNGTAQSTGTKLLSVAGDCERPGIYEVPFGTRVAEVLVWCGGSSAQAVQVSGPSGTCVGSHAFERRLGFEDLPTAGAFTVFGPRRNLFEVALAYTDFFAHESCGFCTPCRVGTSLLKQLMHKIARNQGALQDLDELFKLHRLMQGTSHCGLGSTATRPVFDILTNFRPAFEQRMVSLERVPSFDLDQALSVARQMTGRNDQAAHISPREPSA